jgi:hypothetical protein
MKATELWEILVSISGNEISLADAHTQILNLFGKFQKTELENLTLNCQGCESVTYQGVTYKWGDKVVSPNGYEFFVVTDDGRWGLVDYGCTTFCELQSCDLSGYIHCH